MVFSATVANGSASIGVDVARYAPVVRGEPVTRTARSPAERSSQPRDCRPTPAASRRAPGTRVRRSPDYVQHFGRDYAYGSACGDVYIDSSIYCIVAGYAPV